MTIDFNGYYYEDSFAGPFNDDTFRKFESYLRKCKYKCNKFDPDYIGHLRSFHGGRMKNKCIATTEGDNYTIGRFLNFAGLKHDLKEYYIGAVWSSISDRTDDYLMPFAELLGGDLLAFDHRTSPPEVVVWSHEMSEPEQEPVCYPVAKDFATFLDRISDC